MAGYFTKLMRDLESPVEVRRFGSGWFAGFFALLFAISGFVMVVALKFPAVFTTPELQVVRDWAGFRTAIHVMLLASYALALLSLLLRPRKVLGLTALMIGLAAALLGGASVEADDARGWGMFFGIDFFIVNLLATGFMYAPLERFVPHRREQRLFRHEWREDLFYFLVSSMFVQILAFLSLAPSQIINANTNSWDAFRASVASLPWAVQFITVLVVSDVLQYWYHRLFHQVPFLWGFHAVHHSAKSMDWLAGSRMHIVEIVLLRAVTSLPLFTLGFDAAVMQAYLGFIYVWSSLLHANVGGNFNRLGHWIATPRFHHWHHGLEREAFDVNFAIHFPWIDKLFGTFHLPEDRWPKDYGIPEDVPTGYGGQFLYPWTRTGKKLDEGSGAEPAE
ncbi:MAG: sterol desaturase [Erythrobacter sp.]|nr:sterol desaturase [Erythrobacter sp.]MBA4080572.1 sterol desaturase [Erythrobacter sp.]